MNHSVSQFVSETVSKSVSVSLSILPTVRPSIHTKVHPSICHSVHPSFHHSLHPSIRQTIHPSISQSVVWDIIITFITKDFDNFVRPNCSSTNLHFLLFSCWHMHSYQLEEKYISQPTSLSRIKTVTLYTEKSCLFVCFKLTLTQWTPQLAQVSNNTACVYKAEEKLI